ncbi:phosphate ABC transporter membrane protein 1, PhoT family [Sulfitobacter brevis]|uniref:Phosphate transport system permease protein n=1 Tax=Sulfitobacter brevis TaxID=74348 RepID=A0A1I2FZB5_9RHOB|nr:phosphate ABC transporter permease subunit PstC [Sulfitobacter brevis]SFF10149.1 phosphate ABC transporter membrane protein 1, PhoT family [Sulfitobacter brevis]
MGDLLNSGSATVLALIILGLAALGFALTRRRTVVSVQGDTRRLHSLPAYYGYNAAMLIAVPSLMVIAVWLLVQPVLVQNAVIELIPEEVVAEGSSVGLVMSDVRRVAEGLDSAVAQGAMTVQEAASLDAGATDVRAQLAEIGVALGADVQGPVLAAAQRYRTMTATGRLAMMVTALALALAGFAYAFSRTNADFRARNTVEAGIKALLILAASLAVLTTVGIVLSMLFESINFFRLHDWKDFFLGRSWAPNFRGDSDLSILPLLWGTLYISIIALAVAVPIGLFAAIYLSEYASSTVRSFAKPLLEILAGIPTIVYGLFALLTVGPFLVKIFGRGEDGLLGVDWMSGATSVLTAGLVMGIMLIPFVSSLSDDIINAVPQSLRDGSFGLGATHSETIRQVVLPAALPGIVGAVLLAASRAIGETMIVVLGAGAIARISGNPLEAMTTITTRIVSQLTGDTDFASPETLVAFALGLTLFVLTLGLNVLALYIVRKYREQYE